MATINGMAIINYKWDGDIWEGVGGITSGEAPRARGTAVRSEMRRRSEEAESGKCPWRDGTGATTSRCICQKLTD